MVDSSELTIRLNELVEKGDFEGVFSLINENQTAFSKAINPQGVKDALKKTTKDRLLVSFVEGAEFGTKPLDKSLLALEKLMGFKVGTRVISKAWGLGIIKRIDDFYRRITVDFTTRRGHQFSYAAAVDMLEVPPENHILVRRAADPAAIEKMLKDEPAAFIKEVLRSYGDMPITKLEDVCVSNGFVKSVNWKKFWDGARASLRADKLVEVPSRRAEPIRLRAAPEDYSDTWLQKLMSVTDAKLILEGVREYVGQKKFDVATDKEKAMIGDRLAFAATAARNVDDALYARIASLIVSLGFTKPSVTEMRSYLWERKRYIKAAATLPSREVGAMITFLAVDDEAKARLYASIPEFCYAAVTEVVGQFWEDEACRKAVAALMLQPKAPPTLTTLLVGKYETYKEWEELPALITLLTHAIALGEGRQNGETLKMQNMVRRLFSDRKWLEKVFGWLPENDCVLFFERFQASIAWDPATHHTIVVRMTHLVPALEEHLVKVEKKKEYARETSYRSFAMKKAEYLKLINEDMPENVRKIEFAKSFGDLSENAEYQYAKDEQRQLMQKQSIMQQDLEAVKPSDFASATTDEVMPGVTVVIDTPAGEKTYHVLGEWDNEVDLGVLSMKARLAKNMLGKKVGDQFELPGAEGAVEFAKVKSIIPLPDAIREWMKLPPGMQI